MTSSSWRDEIELEQENTLCRHGARESFWSLRNIYQTPPGVKLWRIASRRVMFHTSTWLAMSPSSLNE